MIIPADLMLWQVEIEAGKNIFSNNRRRNEQRVTNPAAATIKFNFTQGGKDQYGNWSTVYISVGRNDEGQYFGKEDLVECARWFIDEAVKLDRCQRVSKLLHDNDVRVVDGGVAQAVEQLRRAAMADMPRRPEDEEF